MKYKMILSYLGTDFCGWQRQDKSLSVQQVIEEALRTSLREEITLFGSGRTDAGVHALNQIAHFETTQKIDCFKLRYSLNALVRPHPIRIKSIQKVKNDFHARFSALKRYYKYVIQNQSYPPLYQNTSWHIPQKLNINQMRIASQFLIGKHDFSTFRSSECQAKSPIKTMDKITILRKGEFVEFTFVARSFLHHQIRNIVGTLVLVGLKKWTLDDFNQAFLACDRKRGGPMAPPQGLFFTKVQY